VSTTPAFSTTSLTRPVVAVHDDAEALGVGNLLDEDLRAVTAVHPLADRADLGELEQVVAEADHELPAAREAFRHPDDLRDPSRLGLHLVGEVELEQRLLRPALRHSAVAEQVDQLSLRAPGPVTINTSRIPASCMSWSG
jgi:hypothetical protein